MSKVQEQVYAYEESRKEVERLQEELQDARDDMENKTEKMRALLKEHGSLRSGDKSYYLDDGDIKVLKSRSVYDLKE
jgi:hypothetical protein